MRSGEQKVLIPLDNILLFVENPGDYPEPDKRILLRTLKTLCLRYTFDEGGSGHYIHNCYSCFKGNVMEGLVDVVKSYFIQKNISLVGTDNETQLSEGISAINKTDVIDDIVKVWWVSNGMPVIVHNKYIGRYVRRMMRSHEIRGASTNSHSIS